MHVLPSLTTQIQVPETHIVGRTNSLELSSSNLQHATLCIQNKMIKNKQKQLGEERFQLTGYRPTSRESRQEPGVRNWSRGRRRMILTCLPPGSHLATLCSPGPHVRDDTAHHQMASISNLENAPIGKLTDKPIKIIIQLNFIPSSQVYVVDLKKKSRCQVGK